jgi:hypothetical protein
MATAEYRRVCAYGVPDIHIAKVVFMSNTQADTK